MTSATQTIQRRPIKHKSAFDRNATLWGYFFITPAILGLVIFWFGPILYSFILGFTEWNMISPIKFVGLENYKRLLTDPLVKKSLSVTFYYTILVVPSVNIVTLLVASLLNSKIRGLSYYRTIFYIPSIVPAVANSALWLFLCNPKYGLFNQILGAVGLPTLSWLYSSDTVIPTLVLMAVWGSGNTIVIYLAGLQGVPKHLYEAVTVDGGGAFRKFIHITIPMMTPIIFYNLIITIIGSMQTFTQAYIMTKGGPNNASLFYMLHLYRTAFTNQEMGYACVQAWVLFVIIAVLTYINFSLSKKWVHYEGGAA